MSELEEIIDIYCPTFLYQVHSSEITEIQKPTTSGLYCTYMWRFHKSCLTEGVKDQSGQSLESNRTRIKNVSTAKQPNYLIKFDKINRISIKI